MNCLVGFLTLVCLAGCQAVSAADEPVSSPLEQIYEDIQDKFDKLFKTLVEQRESLQNSELGKKFSDFTTEAMQNIQNYQMQLQKQLPPSAKNTLEKFSREIQRRTRKLQLDARDLKQKFQGKFNEMHAQLADQVQERLRVGGEELKKILSELPAKVKPFTEDMKDHIQQQVEPLVQQLQDSFSQGAEQARQSVQPLAEGLMQKMASLAKNVQTSITNVYYSLVEQGQ